MCIFLYLPWQMPIGDAQREGGWRDVLDYSRKAAPATLKWATSASTCAYDREREGLTSSRSCLLHLPQRTGSSITPAKASSILPVPATWLPPTRFTLATAWGFHSNIAVTTCVSGTISIMNTNYALLMSFVAIMLLVWWGLLFALFVDNHFRLFIQL